MPTTSWGILVVNTLIRRKEKRKQQFVASSKVGEFVDSFEKELSFFDCLLSLVPTGSWYIDNGASCHITRVHDIFTILVERDMDLYIEIGVNGKYNAIGLGTITFKRGLDDLLEVMEMLYISRLMRSFLSISLMEDNGMTITFNSR